MLTYDMNDRGELPLYEHLYLCIRRDIESGAIAAGSKLPSKRRLAKNLGVSLITVEGAYAQLLAEGYLRSMERRGYYACDLPSAPAVKASGAKEVSWVRGLDVDDDLLRISRNGEALGEELGDGLVADFRGGSATLGIFPFSSWARSVREALSREPERSLVEESSTAGSLRLRRELCRHLRSVRGMSVEPEQIIIGAGAQILYNMLVQLLGRDGSVALEDPGYPRLAQIYEANGMETCSVALDEQGISMEKLRASGSRIAHVVPSHQFPTGLVTSVSRRYELLAWAAEDPSRIIIEDDFDCEFRLAGRPIPTLQSIDSCGQVIYANTFTKSLGSAFRIGYLVLPPCLVQEYHQKLGFYSCTVSAIDQLALARFMESGEYERHVGRMRSHCRELRDELIAQLRVYGPESLVVHAQDSGLHFLMGFSSELTEEQIAQRALEKGVGLLPLSKFKVGEGGYGAYVSDSDLRWFVMNYAGMDSTVFPTAAKAIFS